MPPINTLLPQRSSRVNLSKIESASRIVSTVLHSDEAQRAFLRSFDKMQLDLDNLRRRRNRFSPSILAEAERLIRVQIEKSTATLIGVTAQAERTLRSAGITELGSWRPDPPTLDAMVFSSDARRYLELICKFDLMMLILETMVIHELISTVEMAQLKARLKTELRHVAYRARDLCSASNKSESALSEECIRCSAVDRAWSSQCESGTRA